MHWGAGCLYWFSLCSCIWPRQNWRKTTYKLDSEPKLGNSDLLHKLQSKLRLLSSLRNTKSKTSVSRFCSHQQGKSQACPETFGLSPLPIKWNSTWILASQWCPVSNLSAHWWGHWSLFKFRSWNMWQESAQCLLCNYSPPTTFGTLVYKGKPTLTTKTFQRMINLSYL